MATRWFNWATPERRWTFAGTADAPAAERVVDERREVAAGPGLHEEPHAPIVEHLDRAPELDRPGPVLDDQRTHRLRVVRERLGRRARVQRDPRHDQRQAIGQLLQPLRVGGEEGGVIGSVEGEQLADDLFPTGDLDDAAGGLGVAHQHHLVGAIVHGHEDLAARLPGDGLGLLAHRAHGQQQRG